MYQGLRSFTLFAMVLEEVSFLDPSLDGLERTLLPVFFLVNGLGRILLWALFTMVLKGVYQ